MMTKWNSRFVLKSIVYLIICKTLLFVLLIYRDYFPPDFRSNFLFGREGYFWGHYRFGFYLHIVAGPISLILGMILLSESFRKRFRDWHRRLGRVQMVCVLGGVVPGGLVMAPYSATGAVAAWGFGTLALATGITAALGWRSAVARQFEAHRRWMLRCYVLLCSAVVLRLIGGIAELTNLDGTYPFAAWASWIVPWIVLELTMRAAGSDPRS